jgi:hypothetical protein
VPANESHTGPPPSPTISELERLAQIPGKLESAVFLDSGVLLARFLGCFGALLLPFDGAQRVCAFICTSLPLHPPEELGAEEGEGAGVGAGA